MQAELVARRSPTASAALAWGRQVAPRQSSSGKGRICRRYHARIRVAETAGLSVRGLVISRPARPPRRSAIAAGLQACEWGRRVCVGCRTEALRPIHGTYLGSRFSTADRHDATALITLWSTLRRRSSFASAGHVHKDRGEMVGVVVHLHIRGGAVGAAKDGARRHWSVRTPLHVHMSECLFWPSSRGAVVIT